MIFRFFPKPIANGIRLWYNYKVEVVLQIRHQTQSNTQRYRSGHNGADSKCKRPRHSRMCESSRFRRFSRKCFIFLEFWMTEFQFRPCKSRAKFKLNLIRRDIEVVITGLTRNQFALTRTRVRIPLSPPLRAKNR